MPGQRINQTVINVEGDAIIGNVNSEYTPILGSTQETDDAWKIRWSALKQLPVNLVIVAILLGANESVSIYLESLSLAPEENQTWLDYLKKGYTYGLATSGIEIIKDFTALAIVEKIFTNVKQVFTGKNEVSLAEEVFAKVNELSATMGESFLSFKNWVTDLVENNNHNLAKEFEQRFAQSEARHAQAMAESEARHAQAMRELESRYAAEIAKLEKKQIKIVEDAKKSLTKLKKSVKKNTRSTKKTRVVFATQGSKTEHISDITVSHTNAASSSITIDNQKSNLKLTVDVDTQSLLSEETSSNPSLPTTPVSPENLQPIASNDSRTVQDFFSNIN